MGLYSRLFRYRARERRAPLEDFLTEALADLFERLPADLAQEFIVQLCLRSEAARARWESTRSGGALHTETQHSIQHPRRGFIDLLIQDHRGRPLIVVESKIYSAVRSHHLDEDEAAAPATTVTPQPGPSPTQLTTYEEWLSSERGGEAWPGAVLFLSHGTAPDARYAAGEAGAGGGPFLGACGWREVAQWLAGASRRRQFEDNTGWRALAGELVNFIRENGMDADLVTSRDLAALELLSPSYGRLAALFDELAKRAGTVWPRTRRFKAFRLDDEGRIFWGYDYPPEVQSGGSWWIGWGVRFPEGSSWWEGAEPPLPLRPHAFVCIAGDGAPLPLAPELIPEGWSRLEGEAVATRSLSSFNDAPEQFTEDVAAWIGAELERALAVLKSLPS